MANVASRPRQAVAALFGALLGLAILVLALPPTLAAYAKIGTDGVLKRIQAHKPVEVMDLRRLIAARQGAAQISPSGRTATDMGLSLMLLSESESLGKAEQMSLRGAARKALRVGLGNAPSNPFAWTRYALAAAIDGEAELAARALAMALRTAPYEPSLTIARLELGFGMWTILSKDARAAILADVKAAWRQDRRGLVAVARRLDAINLVRAGLVGVPDARAAFERLLRGTE